MDVVDLADGDMSSTEARRIISSCARLSQRVFKWARSVTDDSLQQISETKVFKIVQCIRSHGSHSQAIIQDLLDSVTRSCVPYVQCSIAQRTFEECLPKYVVRSAIGDGWEEGNSKISELLVYLI